MNAESQPLQPLPPALLDEFAGLVLTLAAVSTSIRRLRAVPG